MLQNIKLKLVLPKDLDFVRVFFSSVFFAEIWNKSLSLFIEGEDGIFTFALGGSNQKELSDFITGFDDPIDVLSSDFFITEVVEHSDGRVNLILVFHF